MIRTYRFLALTLAAGTLAHAAGCGGTKTEAPKAGDPANQVQAKAGEAKKEEHGHKPGAHGGIIVALGRDSYHAEAVFEKGGLLRLYTLGKDETRIQEVEARSLSAYVKLEGGMDSEKMELKPEPQPGDAPGKTSQFVGQLPKELWGRKVEVTIPSITIAGERFRLGFASASEAHAESDMPPGVSPEEEKKLYLTPGGKYTEADIKANGNMTAARKFKGVMSKHDMKPKPGDKICPVTMTKANPKFVWIVGGKAYEFCCPPCVDEFVKTAKETPEEIKEPREYVKK